MRPFTDRAAAIGTHRRLVAAGGLALVVAGVGVGATMWATATTPALPATCPVSSAEWGVQPGAGLGAPRVPPIVSRALVCWYRGAGTRADTQRLLGRREAGALAPALRASPLVNYVSCPQRSEARVVMYLVGPSTRSTVTVARTGCRYVSDGARFAVSSARLQAFLNKLAPAETVPILAPPTKVPVGAAPTQSRIRRDVPGFHP